MGAVGPGGGKKMSKKQLMQMKMKMKMQMQQKQRRARQTPHLQQMQQPAPR
jgi:hypothetical protein